MITLTLNNTAITLNTHNVEGVELYKAQDLLKGYGMDSKQASKAISNWTASMKNKLPEFQVVTFQGKQGGTYLTKRNTMKLAGYVDGAFEDAVYEAFELLAEGKVEQAVAVTKSVVEIAIEKAIQNNREGKLMGKQVNKALKECVGNPVDMIKVLTDISTNISTVKAGKGREGYWLQARNMVEKLRDEYRQTAKQFDLGIYGQFEEVAHFCTKRIAQVRANNKEVKIVEKEVFLRY